MSVLLGVILVWSVYRMVFGTTHVPIRGIWSPALYRFLGDRRYRFGLMPLVIIACSVWLVDRLGR